MLAAVQQRDHARAVTDHDRADALRPVDLVRADGHEVNAPSQRLERHFAERLYRVDMEKRLGTAAFDPLCDRFGGLDRARFVVDRHDADKDRFVSQKAVERFEVNDTVAVDRRVLYIIAQLGKSFRALVDGGMLHRGDDDPVAATFERLSCAEQYGVVGFRSAGGEDDILRLRAQYFRDGFPRVLYAQLRVDAELMQRRRIAEVLCHHIQRLLSGGF